MHRNQKFYNYLQQRAHHLTEEWYQTLDQSKTGGVYASNDPEVIQALKAQNQQFHQQFIQVFAEDEIDFLELFEEWVVKTAQDGEHLSTPIQFIIKEFMRTRSQYLNEVATFVSLHPDEYSQGLIDAWKDIIVRAHDQVIYKFVEETQKSSELQLRAQQEMIYELSSPVIRLQDDTALLPLVGDIDTARAKMILENTLNQCAEKGISHLYIDLSGVVMIDTMVAHQIFQLIDALNLIGIESTLSGIRPEIALTSMQLGLTFDKISIKSTLSQALATYTAE
ncbi:MULTISPECIES: STAS domain-containing protein [Bacillaceae]|uniref:STAS domain-containing protein n=1 Tax=Bacillaceae TaxID=186817 RepID=UPI000C76B6E1|nr:MULTISPECIES: STAS domain-containing protein [Bacillaceae]PLR69218.1 RsbT co-antagonist protein RsbRB [Bacillus sp. UMB0893]QNG59315.1 STAS domain-containing protein [Bacillus sp. PAMC26568]